MCLVIVAYALDKTPTLHNTHAIWRYRIHFLTQEVDDQHGIAKCQKKLLPKSYINIRPNNIIQWA